MPRLRCVIRSAIAGLALSLSAVPTAWAQVYRVRDLGTLGGMQSYANAINDVGQVVGYSQTSMGDAHAFLYDYHSATMTDLGVLAQGPTIPGGGWSDAGDINDLGQVVGGSYGADGNGHAFLYQGGSLIDLGTPPGSDRGGAVGINDRGQIIGTADLSGSSLRRAFLAEGASMMDLGDFGGKESFGIAINNAGQILVERNEFEDFSFKNYLYDISTGVATELVRLDGLRYAAPLTLNDVGQMAGMARMETADGSFPLHAFLYDSRSDVLRDLGTLGGQESNAFGINTKGQVVGWANTPAFDRFGQLVRATLFTASGPVDLNSLIRSDSGITLTNATGINDKGWIIADGFVGSDGSQEHAFLLVAGPEPGTLPLALAGLAGFGGLTLVRRQRGTRRGKRGDTQ